MTIINADCLEWMKSQPDNSIDCVVTDPPYGLKFMSKKWDYDIPSVELWTELLRVCKPGAMMLCFGGSRTYHRLACRIEDAGWEIRDSILYWGYGSGFPKSHNFGCKCTGDSVQYSNDKVSLSTSEDLQNLQTDILLSQSYSSQPKCGVFSNLSYNSNDCKKSEETVSRKEMDASQMRTLSERDLETKLLSEKNEYADMFPNMQREGTLKEFDQIQQQRDRKETSWQGIGDGKESCLEGRRNLQEEQRELHRPEICEMSTGIHGDGSEGRLCDGTSPRNGETPEQNSSESGSSTSQRPQHTEQSNRESGAFREQSSSQERRGETCETCKGIIGFEGYGTALKPAYEPIIMAMKPLDGTFKQNAEKWGVAGINIDASRIESNGEHKIKEVKGRGDSFLNESKGMYTPGRGFIPKNSDLGRWPANIILDEEAGALLDQKSGILKSPGSQKRRTNESGQSWKNSCKEIIPASYLPPDSGGASRFFYCAKASTSERNAGLDKPSIHPTVKPLRLMEYLIKLVMPPKEGILLDPFAGSGTTILAAQNLGFNAIGIEREKDYCDIANARLKNGTKQMPLLLY